MVSFVRSWRSLAVCTVVLGMISTSWASESNLWGHFSVGQASYQVVENPFGQEPAAPAVQPLPQPMVPEATPPEPAPLQPMVPEATPVQPTPAAGMPSEPSRAERTPTEQVQPQATPPNQLPPDPAYRVPMPLPPTRREPPSAPMVPPEAEHIPPGQPGDFMPPRTDVWEEGCAEDTCVYGATASERGTLFSSLRRWTCDPCCGSGAAFGPNSRRHGGLPLGIGWEGWIAQGVTLNTRSPRNRSNLPVTFNDGSNEYQMNQLYLIAERAVRDDAWSVGGRIDLLYGTDHRYTMARGLETDRDMGPKWNSGDYGLAIPQLYMEAFAPIGPGVSVKMGHFYTILGYESVPAPANFFYSHAYAMQYGEPFTHTGLLAASDIGPLKLQAGLTRGWNNWESNSDDCGFLGSLGWVSPDERTSLSFAIHTGREEGPLAPATNSRTTYSLVFTRNLHGPWSYVLQHDLGVDQDAMLDGTDANWYGLKMYLFREIREHWKFGYRFEWFCDRDGTRVITGQAADYYQMSWGLNYSPSDRLRIRPSLRWDWTGARGSRPFADGTRDEQLLLDCDVLVMF